MELDYQEIGRRIAKRRRELGYKQAQVEELTASLSAKEQEAAQLRETVAAKEAAIEAQSQELAALKEDGTAAAEAQLQAAYTEGVESNG